MRSSKQKKRRRHQSGRLDVLEQRLLMAVNDVVINEIMYNSATAETADEYVELYNRTGAAINLNGRHSPPGLGSRRSPSHSPARLPRGICWSGGSVSTTPPSRCRYRTT